MSNWISVKDRLPGLGRVLIKTTNCGMMVASMCIPTQFPEKWVWGVINEIEFMPDEVTHWQPLPPAPTAEGE